MININPAISGFQNVVELIKANNGGELFAYTLTPENVILGAPAFFDDVANADANTTISVTAIQDAGFSGAVDISYYRPTLEEASVVPAEQIEVDTVGAEDDQVAYEARVKAAIAAALQIRPEDFVLTDAGSVGIPENENNPVNVSITPVATSLLYSGGAFMVSVAAIDVDIPLNTVITVTALNGFDF